ncbi:MAG: prepilin-type N-terminal cleavage/methylation domain-containing protein [Clostridia bacterium]|nr:prepilin-type N-terminal cleavage/methylation domain-containing protein [Clostridia bacterium]
MKNIIKSYFGNKRGMTLVEVLTAMAILSLIIFCFTPLFLTYFKTITIAGKEVQNVQDQSGVLQTVIGNFNAGKGGNYSANVTEIGLELTTPSTAVLTRKQNDTTISATMNGAVTVALGNNLDNIKGDFLVSNPENLRDGYTTISAQGSSSGLVCYPKTLTDDFIEAKIIVYGSGGITFGDSSYVNDFKLYCGLNGSTSLSNGTDYTVRKLANSMVEFTIYGGGKISFETSPLLIYYKGGQHILQVEVDAPSMIMVGEKSDDNKYYYYVSRGELVDGADSDSTKDELAIIRREMNSVDPRAGNTVTTLTSAMNDVEWVPADSGDGYNVDNSGKKYGYYVMCGDNGQVRRFWRNNTTGNYYWGGDYTYYTDYNFDQFSSSRYINGTNTYSTGTSFKFVSQRSMSSTQSGFNVASKEFMDSTTGLINVGTGLLRSLSVVAVTSADTGEFYGSDGALYFYKIRDNDSYRLPTYLEIQSFTVNSNGKGKYEPYGDFGGNRVFKMNTISNTAHGWFKLNGDSYYEINGITNVPQADRASYPITLTSVDAIRINTPNKTDVKNDGSYYFTSTGNGDTTAEGATTNLNYPQSSYTLYCGYIPAFMDLFATTTGSSKYKYPTSWDGTYAHSEVSGFYQVGNQYLKRADNRLTLQDNANHYAYWRMTLGLTPYYNDGSTTVKIGDGELAYKDGETQKEGGFLGIGAKEYRWHNKVVYYPYKNLEYAITGKFYDSYTFTNKYNKVQEQFGTDLTNSASYVLADPNMLINTYQNVQTNVTNGEVVDITISYLSHPFAIAVGANPTDDIVYDLDNQKSGNNQVFYWNNRRETITFLDSASTVVPAGDKDIPVSLMVGYVLGGTVDFAGDQKIASTENVTITVGSVMNHGIVFLRSGDYNYDKTQNSANGQTYEYMATDNGGYKLNVESNVFHQFYYLNSRAKIGGSYGHHGEYSDEPNKGKHIGNLYGADYWQNNRHIQYKSITGGTATNGSDTSTNYEYLRSHPMSNTKVTCVAWGVTWQAYPEAMWGTENGTVLSWWVNTTTTQGSHTDQDWNDRSVDAEFQSYKWIDNVNNKTFALDSTEYKDTVGSAVWGTGSTTGRQFSPGSSNFKYFYDKTTQQLFELGDGGAASAIAFVSTLENINDIAYDNDYWVAVGDQSNADPADYCGTGTAYGAYPYTENGRGGSWVNVRYWVNLEGEDGKHSENNAWYHWRAVKISANENYNIVQINNVNGIWVATGYEDANNNDDYDAGERTVVCWARNPLKSCNQRIEGGWSEEVQFYANNGASMTMLDQNKVGGINSCATRSE